MENKDLLITLAKERDNGTGMLQVAANMVRVSGDPLQKAQALINLFEASKPHWPPMSKDGSITPDCKKGCALCCYLNVDVLEMEMDLIWEKMNKQFTQDEIKDILAKARENYDKKFHVGGYEKRLRTRLRCPFLGPDNCCRIYEDRPLSCRGMYSGNYSDCEKGHSENLDQGNTFWAAPWMVADDILTGATVGHIKAGADPSEGKIVQTLEVALLRKADPSVKQYQD